ncbi:MAG: glycosyltransferase [Kiritimatiellae bacterium]|nr:glycosyltransferase [Kiritimatiellia bacterium]
MPPSVLIVASTRAYADSQEILRIQDTAAALLECGNAVDVLVPRTSTLLTSVLSPAVRVFTVPRLVPFMHNPPRRPSIRRFLVGALMLFRGIALLSRRRYTALHGVNDGALVVRAISGFATVGRLPFIAEVHRPFARPGMVKGPRAAFARFCERRALRRAAAIVLPDEQTLALFGRNIPRARVSLIPDPHVELVPTAFTFAEFSAALRHVYTYALGPRGI